MKRPCLEPGCPLLVEDGSRCREHRLAHDRRRARRGSTWRWRKLRERALRRDDYRCVLCGRPYPLEVDHINGDPNDDRLTNLRTLCRPCHKERHGAG